MLLQLLLFQGKWTLELLITGLEDFFPLTLVGDCFLLLPFVFLQHPKLGKNHLLI